MKTARKIPALFFLTIAIFFFAHSAFAQLQFIENKGQWDKAVDFKSDIPTGAFFLQQKGFTVMMHNPEDLKVFSEFFHGHNGTGDKSKTTAPAASNDPLTIRSHAYRVSFLGAAPNVKFTPDKALPTYNNYFIGSDQSKWKGNCKIFQGVTYKNMYPNIDVRYYTDQGTLKYDLIVHPGGNIDDIAIQYEGADKLQVKNKELIIGTSVGEVKELYPYTYQVQDAGREVLDCKYVLEKNIVRFKVKDYSRKATVVIDPTLIFCSFTGSTADNWGYTATPGPDGSLFAGGIAIAPGVFPVSLGAYQFSFGGGISSDYPGAQDIAIIKFSPNGVNRVYATYLGGGGNEQPHSMICDAQGNLIVAGRTNSQNYPVRGAPPGLGSSRYDIVVTKFNAAGNDIIGSLRIGGSGDDGVNISPKYVPVDGTSGAIETRRNYGDDARSEVILDANNNICLASCTMSTDFPLTASPVQGSFGGGRQDGVIMKFTPNLDNVLFSTFFGGRGSDACFVLSINPLTGNLYVAGATTGADLPGNSTGVIYPANQGGITDGFITELTPTGSAIIRTTFVGTGGNDLIYGIKFDKFGFPYICGTTTGNWPVVNAAFSNAGSRQFISKLKPDLSAFEYSTVFGSGSAIPNISITALLVDRCQNVYVSGWGGQFNNERGYPCAGTRGLPTTANATQSTTDGNDFYFFVLERNASSQLFGSFFGQRGGFDDHVDGGTSRFDENGIIYQAICANCEGQAFFPTTPGVWATTNGSAACNEAVVKIEMNFAGIGASVKATVNGVVDTIGCVPLTIKFTDTLAKGKKYIWDFGDGSPKVTTNAPKNDTSHIYTRVGNYTLTLVSIDSATCNIADTAYVTVKVGNNQVVPKFIASKLPPCTNLTFRFDNITTASRPAYTNQTFIWDFGDGSPKQRAGFTSVQHTYAAEGTYTVLLVVDDTTFCNSPDSVKGIVRLATNVKAVINAPDKGCVPYVAEFVNDSRGGTDFTWNFGDGSAPVVDNSPVVTHLYNRTGNYTVTLLALDTSTCNKRDSVSKTFTVFAVPTAAFDFSPKPAQENKPTLFSNQSSGATTYKWIFGDGETSTMENPSHQFNATRVYNVCLVAINEAGCSDTVCHDVEAKVQPLLDVPNAFTPGKFGVNSIIKVVGFGIGKMDWRIYNRWGQVVFTTNNRNDGWDGTFKGALQPMDVYTYTLDVEFSDGKKLRKTGDITLLR